MLSKDDLHLPPNPIFMDTGPWLLCMVALEAHFVNGWRYGPIYMCFVMCDSILRLFADY